MSYPDSSLFHVFFGQIQKKLALDHSSIVDQDCGLSNLDDQLVTIEAGGAA